MKVSVIIPSYNEAATLSKIVKQVFSIKLPYSKEIIVVDDGSTDDTGTIFKNLSQIRDLKLITNKINLGKGASIRKALKIASGDVVLIQDADLEYDPRDIPKILNQFADKNVKVVYGSRVLSKNPVSHWSFYLGGRSITFIANILFNTEITDEPTGYKAFRKEILVNLKLKSTGFEFCPEVTAKLAKKKIKIVEVPISYNPRPVSEKKIKWHDGLAAIFYLIKYRITN